MLFLIKIFILSSKIVYFGTKIFSKRSKIGNFWSITFSFRLGRIRSMNVHGRSRGPGVQTLGRFWSYHFLGSRMHFYYVYLIVRDYIDNSFCNVKIIWPRVSGHQATFQKSSEKLIATDCTDCIIEIILRSFSYSLRPGSIHFSRI